MLRQARSQNGKPFSRESGESVVSCGVLGWYLPTRCPKQEQQSTQHHVQRSGQETVQTERCNEAEAHTTEKQQQEQLAELQEIPKYKQQSEQQEEEQLEQHRWLQHEEQVS